MKKIQLLSIGTMYIDINCIHFPFTKGLFVNRETTGNEYALELGGSALNFAKLTNALGLHTTFIGKVGDDRMGKHLLTLLKQHDIKPAVVIDPRTQTNLAIHYIHEDGSSIMTSCGSANQHLNAEDITTMLKLHGKRIDFLYLGGSFKLKHLLPHLPAIAKQAKKQGSKIILDHGRVNNTVTQEDIENIYALMPFVDIYLPSIDEFCNVWKVKDTYEGYQKVRHLSQALVIIKQGELGAVGYENDQKIIVPAFSVNPINTVGAGDSFNAGFIKAYSQHQTMRECMQFACATAAVKISQQTFSIQAILPTMNNRAYSKK